MNSASSCEPVDRGARAVDGRLLVLAELGLLVGQVEHLGQVGDLARESIVEIELALRGARART